jgi:hypothetical protein
MVIKVSRHLFPHILPPAPSGFDRRMANPGYDDGSSFQTVPVAGTMVRARLYRLFECPPVGAESAASIGSSLLDSSIAHVARREAPTGDKRDALTGGAIQSHYSCRRVWQCGHAACRIFSPLTIAVE